MAVALDLLVNICMSGKIQAEEKGLLCWVVQEADLKQVTGTRRLKGLHHQ